MSIKYYIIVNVACELFTNNSERIEKSRSNASVHGVLSITNMSVANRFVGTKKAVSLKRYMYTYYNSSVCTCVQNPEREFNSRRKIRMEIRYGYNALRKFDPGREDEDREE